MTKNKRCFFYNFLAYLTITLILLFFDYVEAILLFVGLILMIAYTIKFLGVSFAFTENAKCSCQRIDKVRTKVKSIYVMKDAQNEEEERSDFKCSNF